MRLAQFACNSRQAVGAIVEDVVVDLSPAVGGRSLKQVVADWSQLEAGVRDAVASKRSALALSGARLKAPLPEPGKFILLAGNYQDHLAECGLQRAPAGRIMPQLFWKPSTSIIGPGEAIVVSPRNVAVDWEAELAVVIGRRARDVAREEALRYVFGYTIVNDVSERRLNSNVPGRVMRQADDFFDWLAGKWFDTFAPMGPVVTTADEIRDPSRLTIKARLNREEVQNCGTSAMITDVPQTIAYISSIVTLEPGDVVATGTPAGVGLGRGRFFQPGDVIECEIDGIGTLANPVTGSYR